MLTIVSRLCTGFYELWIAGLSCLLPGSAQQWIAAASKALEAPPTNPAAQRYGVIGFCCFLAFSALVFTAALVDTRPEMRLVSEVFGWFGIVCLHVCVFCVVRYPVVNKKHKFDEWSQF